MPRVLTAKDYSVIYRVHINTVRKLLREGAIPNAMRIGKSWRIVIPDS